MDIKHLIELAEIVSNYKDAIVIRTPQAVDLAEGYLQLAKEHAIMREALERIADGEYVEANEIAQKAIKEVSGE